MLAVVTISTVGSRRVSFAFCHATQQPDGALTLRYVAIRVEGDVLIPDWETPDHPNLPIRIPPGFVGLGHGRIFYNIDDFDPGVVYRRVERDAMSHTEKARMDLGGVDPVGAGDVAGVSGDADVGGLHPDQADGDAGHVVAPSPADGGPPRQ
jgi:hypothetical protein